MVRIKRDKLLELNVFDAQIIDQVCENSLNKSTY